MDAVEFIKQVRRMGKQKGEAICFKLEEKDTEIVEQVEQWAKEHPVKTRQSEFLKIYPNARIDDGVIFLGPCAIDKSHKCTLDCKKCCRDYWLKEVE